MFCFTFFFSIGSLFIFSILILFQIKKMARGRSRGHKGGRKQFSNPDQIKEDLRKVPLVYKLLGTVMKV